MPEKLWARPTPRPRLTAKLITLGATSSPFGRVAIAAALSLATAACGVQGLSFVQDKRVDVIHPKDRSTVTLPVKVQWTVKDFRAGPSAGSFGVFVDQAPQPSGQSLAWVVRGESGCKGTGAATCATPEFLAQRNIFRTTDTSFTVEQVPRLTGSEASRQLHDVTVVLLDANGTRVGEGAWSVQFQVKDQT